MQDEPSMSDAMATKSTALAVATSLGMGLTFGFCIERSRVFVPQIIVDQMLMQRFTMLKMFLSAVAAGQLCIVGLSHLAPRHFQAAKTYTNAAEQSWARGAVGAAVLGAGMAVGGACPGMVLAQVGAGVHNSGLVFLGGLLGATAFGVAEPALAKAMPLSRITHQLKSVESNFRTAATGFAVAMMAFVAVVESLRPWQADIDVPLAAGRHGLLSASAWSPELAGASIGLMQIPAVLVFGTTLGSSTSYCVIVSRTASSMSLNLPKYLRKYAVGSCQTWWQAFYVAGAIAGAMLSNQLAAEARIGASPVAGQSALVALSAGFLLVFGSRLAGGCTSGHGLSGMAFLSNHSVLAVASMFGGGMAVAFTGRALGLL